MLEALGVTVKRTGVCTKVVAADSRVQRINDSITQRRTSVPTELPKLTNTDVSDLHKACRQGNIHDVTFLTESNPSLIQAKSPNSEDGLGCGAVALHFATIGNQPHIIACLLQKGAKADVATDRGVTPLHVACARGFDACADALMKGGANALTTDRYGKSSYSILKQQCGDVDMRKQRASILRTVEKRDNVHSSRNNAILEVADRILYTKR